MRIPRTNSVNKEEVLSKTKIKRTPLHRIRKIRLNFLEHIMRKEERFREFDRHGTKGTVVGDRPSTWTACVNGWQNEFSRDDKKGNVTKSFK